MTTSDFEVIVGRVPQNGFQDVTFLPSELVFTSHFLGKIMVEVNEVNGVSKGILPVKYFHANKYSFCVSSISLRSLD